MYDERNIFSEGLGDSMFDYGGFENKLKKDMTKNELVSFINKEISHKNWTDDEVMKGKKVYVLPEWADNLHFVVSKFKIKGWELFWISDGIKDKGQKQYLEFPCPWKDDRR